MTNKSKYKPSDEVVDNIEVLDEEPLDIANLEEVESPVVTKPLRKKAKASKKASVTKKAATSTKAEPVTGRSFYNPNKQR